MSQVLEALPVLDPGAVERLRALAAAVARPGEDVLGHLAGLFIEDSAERLTSLRDAWRAGRVDDAARAAHTIKGSAGNVGAARVAAVAVVIERDTRLVPFSAERIRPLEDELAAAWAALRAEFQSSG